MGSAALEPSRRFAQSWFPHHVSRKVKTMNQNIKLQHLFSGLRAVIVGGDPQPAQVQRIQTSLSFDEVIHCTTRKSDASSRAFERALLSGDIVLAVWLWGVSRTSHGERFREICRSIDLPWIEVRHMPHPRKLAALVESLGLRPKLLRRRDVLLSDSNGGQAR